MRSPEFARAVAALALLIALPATAAVEDFEFGRYLSKYPGMYSTLTLSNDARDRVFDQGGRRVGSAAPTYGDGSGFAERAARTQFEWHFPMFESERLPLISDRLWTARAGLGYTLLATDGPIKDFIAQHGLSEKGQGLTDLQLEFGPVLWGSRDWRTRHETPLSLLLLAQAGLPLGARDADAPNNAGSNAFSYGAKLGAHWRPLRGVLVDAGVAGRWYGRNDEPAFGAQEPARQGSDLTLDATLAARIVSGVYASVGVLERHGSANRYEKVRFTATAPTASAGMETFADPAPQFDAGTRERRLGLALHWFVLPRLDAGLHFLKALSGRSGEFDQPYLQQTVGCAGTAGCNPQPNGSAHVDGLGGARSYATNVWMLSLRWSYGQGDLWF
jgi:hypothetical protein